MIKSNQLVEIKWNSANKDHYIKKWYSFTKINDSFYVEAEDLPRYSSKKITVICDYCGREYEVIYKNYMKSTSCGKKKTCCKSCAKLKLRDSIREKYGVDYFTDTEVFKQKTKQTVYDKYGVDNVSQIDWVQNKKKRTNLSKFGEEWFPASETFKEKCVEKFGVDNPMKNESCKIRAGKTAFKNGSVPVSKEEQKFVNKLIEIFGKERCVPSFSVSKYFMDCLLVFNGIQIDIEYDGWYWHTQKQNNDEKRNEIILSKNFKVLRFISKGRIPTKNQIIEGVNRILEGKNLVIIYI